MVCLLPSVPPFMLCHEVYPEDVCIDMRQVLAITSTVFVQKINYMIS